MFAQLKGIVDLLTSSIKTFRDFKTSKQREDNVLELLKIYFVFKDCVDESESLISDAGTDPVAKVASMSAEDAAHTLSRWDSALTRQAFRLRALEQHLLGQDELAVIDPALQDQIIRVIGYKMDSAVTLHGIGAALVIRVMFPVAVTDEERAVYISVMAGSEDRQIDIPRVRLEISALRAALDEYRKVVERFVSSDELLRFSKKAREATLMAPADDEGKAIRLKGRATHEGD